MTWITTRLKHLCVDAGQYGLNVSANDYVANGYRLIRTTDIDEAGQLRSRDNGVFVDTDLDRRHELEPGDLLLTRSGATVGRSMLVGELDEPSTFAGYLVRYRPLATTEPRFLAYIAASRGFQEAIKSDAVTATIQNFNAERYANITVVAPPLDEQRRIADFLDAETARVDSLIESKTRVIALLEERRQAVINKATPGTIVRGIDGRPIGISGMDCVRLGAVASVHGGFTMDEGRDTGADSVTMPYLRVANVLDGSLALEDVKEVMLPRVMAERYTLRPGDVLMTEGGDPDKLGRGTVWPGDFGPCLHQNAIFAVRPDARLLPEYLALVTRTRYARAYFEVTASKSTGIAHTSSTKITSFRVPLPSVPEQCQVVAAISESVARINALREPTQQQVKLLAERRQALITAAVTGGIAV